MLLGWSSDQEGFAAGAILAGPSEGITTLNVCTDFGWVGDDFMVTIL